MKYLIQSHRRAYTFDTLQSAEDYAQKVFAKTGAIVAITEAPDPVKVIFRKWPASQGGEILALFPEIPACPDGYHCQSYQHTGQHSAADLQGCIAATRPATVAESAALIRELESAPFHYSLRIIARTPADAYRTRREALTH